MKKVIFGILMVLLCSTFVSYAAELKVGDKLGDFKLKAALDNKEYSLSSPEFAGRVVYITFAHASAADDNNNVTEALLANKDVDRLKKENKYVGLGIGNQKDSWQPDAAIKFIAKRKQKESGSMILLDPDFTYGSVVGAPHKTVTSILVDKERVIRYIYKGKTPAENIPKIIDLIKKYSEAK